jgi:hypothetical protein
LGELSKAGEITKSMENTIKLTLHRRRCQCGRKFKFADERERGSCQQCLLYKSPTAVWWDLDSYLQDMPEDEI